MFAIALVDRKQRRLLLARDRFGIKPLFYRHHGGRLSAASELKALLVEGVPRASRAALALGAIRMHVPWPLTAFEGIYRLPPGAVLELEVGRHRGWFAGSRWSIRPTSLRPSPGEALDVLRAAVARQMVADVPVGAFLSGGVDSTLIVALMRQITNGELHTFSVRRRRGHSGVAAVTARELGTTHHTIEMDEITFEDLTRLPALFDEPFAETTAIGVRALSRFAREHVKVALSGDGGDEVFGGYGSYRWIQTLGRIPIPGRSLMGRAARALLVRRAWPSSIRRVLRGLVLVGDTPMTAQRDVSTLAWAADAETRAASEWLSGQIEHESGIDLDDLDALRRSMLADRLERLSNAMLSKVDIASMSASLEVRVPMLDDQLVRFADRLAADHLVDKGQGKVLLRKVLATLPGGRVAWDTKRGFSLPLESWLRNPKTSGRLTELFGDRARSLRDLTGTDVVGLWSSFLDGSSRYSGGTAAMQLLWFANVAMWADLFDIRDVAVTALDHAPIV